MKTENENQETSTRLITYRKLEEACENSNLLVKKFLLSNHCEAFAYSRNFNDFLRIPSIYIKKMVNRENNNVEAFFELPTDYVDIIERDQLVSELKNTEMKYIIPKEDHHDLCIHFRNPSQQMISIKDEVLFKDTQNFNAENFSHNEDYSLITIAGESITVENQSQREIIKFMNEEKHNGREIIKHGEIIKKCTGHNNDPRIINIFLHGYGPRLRELLVKNAKPGWYRLEHKLMPIPRS